MINLVLFGPPGAGKGTQAEALKGKYGFLHASTGDIIRSEIKNGTPLGLKVADIIARGELVPDADVINIIEAFLSKNSDSPGIIFDGFPRTTFQAVELDKILAKYGLCIDLMLSLETPDDVLIERILKRSEISGRADDADVDIIRHRIAVYKEQTAVVADYYAAQGKFVPVDGTLSIEDVFERLCAAIDNIRK